MQDIILDIINYIIGRELATAKDVDIFRDFAPTLPDSCISIFEYSGSEPAPFTTMSVRSFQVVVRDKSQISAKDLSWLIYKSLYQEDLQITLGAKLCIIKMRNTPIKIYVDEQGRTGVAFNLALTTNFN